MDTDALEIARRRLAERRESQGRQQAATLPCLIAGCPVPAADVAYCREHRRMADDGSLLLRCIFDDGHAPVAPHDPIACAEHRRQLDAMPDDPPVDRAS